jgi:multiple sugar transport system substrate-binding protein
MKKIVSILMLSILLISISACRGSNTPDPDDDTGLISLKYWNSLTGADGDVMRQMIAQFNASHEGEIQVIETFTNEIDYYTNINLLIPQGRGPDVMIMHSYLVQSYANSGILKPIDDYLNVSGVNVNPEDYITNVMQSLYYEEQLYGIPLDIHTIGMYYNVDLLNKYNLEVPTNRSEMIAASKTVQEGEKALGNNVWGLPLSIVWPSEWLFTASLYQNNGLEIDASLNPAYNSTEGANALKALADLIHVEKISPTNLSVDQDLFMFQSGRALFHMQGSWMLNAIKESGINFGVTPISQMFNEGDEAYKQSIPARSHTFVVPDQGNDVSDARKEAVMTFIKYLGDNSALWATAGQIPASNVARQTQAYLDIPYIANFGRIEDFKVSAQSPYFHEAFSPVYSRVTAALSNANYASSQLLTAAVEEALQLLSEARSRS